MKKAFVGFSISSDYRRSTVWHFKVNGQLAGTLKTTIDKGKTRQERYDLQVKALGFSKIFPGQIPQFSKTSK